MCPVSSFGCEGEGTERPVSSTIPRAPAKAPLDPWELSGLTCGPRRCSCRSPSLLSPHPAPRPAGTPQSGSRKKSPRPPKPTKSTRAPLLTAGAPRQGKSAQASPLQQIWMG